MIRVYTAGLGVVSYPGALIRHQLELNNVALEQNFGTGLPQVMCDSNQIQQIVLGLLVNATEASPTSISIETEQTLQPVPSVIIHVRDNGSGITPDVMPHLFEPFYTTKTDEQRTGLGLAVAKSIVEQHGGDISVKSKAGEGAEFIIRLPVEQASKQVSEPQYERQLQS